MASRSVSIWCRPSRSASLMSRMSAEVILPSMISLTDGMTLTASPAPDGDGVDVADQCGVRARDRDDEGGGARLACSGFDVVPRAHDVNAADSAVLEHGVVVQDPDWQIDAVRVADHRLHDLRATIAGTEDEHLGGRRLVRAQRPFEHVAPHVAGGEHQDQGDKRADERRTRRDGTVLESEVVERGEDQPDADDRGREPGHLIEAAVPVAAAVEVQEVPDDELQAGSPPRRSRRWPGRRRPRS